MTVLKVDPENASAYRFLGLARLRQNKIDEAIGHLRHALDLRPDFPAAKAGLDEALAARDFHPGEQAHPASR